MLVTAHMIVSDTAATMAAMGVAAKDAARVLAQSTAAERTRALELAAEAIRDNAAAILVANAEDMASASGLSGAMRDRLMLDAKRVAATADGVAMVAALPDPLGEVIKDWTQPNGLHFQRVRVPIGVIGIVYESRPNVTADAGALCLRSGNAAILRGGSESLRSSRALHEAMLDGLAAAGLPRTAIQLVPTADRAAVGAMLAGLDGALDLMIPRGGKSLVARVQAEARVPVLGHLEGLNHTYIHAAADPTKARAIVLNAKLRRTGVCGSTETVLVDRAVMTTLGHAIAADLLAAGCAIRGDESAEALDPRITAAHEADWRTEYLDAIVNLKAVAGLDEAVAHIAGYGTQHTDAIVTEDAAAAEAFLARVDSAIVLWNASTQFADGGEFGFGAEIGIATGKLHARGPVGAAELTAYKTIVRGSGQIRP
ncbi:Gamma-glutamyl phosphate reductase [Alphaproteobacteria bacterium SO-S41]|nr:Gamma-glutamyl phosphate reductase [Alphaproteobacteria bacterium SO-S41]